MKQLKKLKDTVKALWFWYVVRAWWYVVPPKSDNIRKSHAEPGQTLDDD